MRINLHLGLNIVLVLGLSMMGLITHGPTYMTYIMGAGAIYFLVSSWLRSHESSQAMVAGIGCAWGWLAMVDGLMARRWPGMVIGLLVIAVWVIPAMRGEFGDTEKKSGKQTGSHPCKGAKRIANNAAVDKPPRANKDGRKGGKHDQ